MRWEDLFYIEKVIEKKFLETTWYRAVFKHNDEPLNKYSFCRTRQAAEAQAFNWVNNKSNEKTILEISIENILVDQ